MKFEPLILNEDFRAILLEIESNSDHLFITGRAGTGKSTLLDLIRRTTKKNTVVLAPTGIAALNVSGVTIHSFFGFAPHIEDLSAIKKVQNHRIYKTLELLIIDEISMVRGDLLDRIDIFLKKNRENNLPFGGVQVIFFGDLFQLPPVVNQQDKAILQHLNYKSPYFFDARIFDKNFQIRTIQLNRVFRQKEKNFITFLDRIRTGRFDQDDLDMINTRHLTYGLTDIHGLLTLTTTNAKSDQINKERLDSIERPSKRYIGQTTGIFPNQNLPADMILDLKPESQIIFIKNDPNKMYVNGSIGLVRECLEHSVIIDIQQGEKLISLEIFQQEWHAIKYIQLDQPGKGSRIDMEIVGVFRQLPLKLAWAITIHKSQGKTFEKVFIDLDRGSFAHGQTYVALSRCRYLEGILLSRPIRQSDIIIDETIIEYYDQQR